MAKYPTEAEIRTGLTVPDPKDLWLVQHFLKFMGSHADLNQIGAWMVLFLRQTGIKAIVSVDPNGRDSFDHNTRTITLATPSLVIALHEIGHAKFGRSELIACQYSWSLIKWADPALFAKAVVNGHRLTL